MVYRKKISLMFILLLRANNNNINNIMSTTYPINTCDMVALVLEHIVKQFENQKAKSGTFCYTDRILDKLTKFNSKRPPAIPIRHYMKRIEQYAKCSESCYIGALIYLDRAMQNGHITLRSLNIHRLIITSMLLSIKYLEDFYYDNEYYAKVGGLSLREINDLEAEMLQMLGFSVHIEEAIYYKYKEDIEEFVKNRLYKTVESSKEEEKGTMPMIVDPSSNPH